MDNLQSALDPQQPAAALTALAPDAPQQRLSLNSAAYYQTQWLGLLIVGQSKRELLEQAARREHQLPIRYFIEHSPVPIQVYWAP